MYRRFLSKATTRTMSSLVEQSKKLAAYKAVDENLKDSHSVVGVGSGSTVVYVAERLGQLEHKSSFVCIPTGFQSKELILSNGLRLGSVEEYSSIDIAFDGADEIDSQLNLIKGGGACLMQEKLVASCSKQLFIVADYRKRSPEKLGHAWRQGVPIEVVPAAYNKVLNDLKNLEGYKSAKVRYGGTFKAGPVVTDNSMFIIDADFGEIPVEKVSTLHSQIKGLVGVLETGLFANMTTAAYIGNEDGSVATLTL
ncbi:Ribose-5-phosphate ketol-isomerase [Komagataella phaffii GS115]|uniref:Ribose-5-phosphate isomerase n=2 Tax=Komagataella phaffii TaxID=460519 RepID=C4R764_KOMPG|nr:Ribose-5-phosphate ketol-isomerase [Komagataella phaffii GS115]CAY71439.1 Ribose-5-phosphate ketol-isomerase [Komagataella phaffii GS115]